MSFRSRSFAQGRRFQGRGRGADLRQVLRRRRAQRIRGIQRGQRGFVRVGGYYGRYSGSNPEMKFKDTTVDDGVVAASMNVQTALLVIAEGNGESQRVGRKVTVKRIGWRYEVLLPTTATAADTSDVVRVVLVLDKQANGALPVATDVFEDDDYQSFNNLANSQRFRILMDKSYSIATPAGSGRGTTDTLSYGDNVITAQWHKTCNIPIEYDNSATTGVITSIRSNNIFAVVGSKSGVAGFRSKLRIRYTDR